jgi:hypothetical protein
MSFHCSCEVLFACVLNVVLSVNALHNGDFFWHNSHEAKEKERCTGTSCLSVHHTFDLSKVISHFNETFYEILKFGKCVFGCCGPIALILKT